MLSQVYSSLVLHGNHYRPDHHGHIKTAYDLVDYYDNNIPTLVYGCYNTIDYNLIQHHRSGVVLIWGGSDVINMKKNKFKFGNNVKHIALSKSNQDELKKYGIISEYRILLKAKPEEYPITPLGNKVYVYMPFKRRKFYGFNMIRAISKRIDVKFILARYGIRKTVIRNAEMYPLISQDQLKKIYSETLCCIRPTLHDGFPQTFLELGLMGRRCAWPHEPGIAVSCNSVKSYVAFIRSEQKRKIPHNDIRDMIVKLGNRDFLNWF